MIALLVRVWSRLLPPGVREYLKADVEEALGTGRGIRWLLGEVFRTPYFGLWRRHLRQPRHRRVGFAKQGGGWVMGTTLGITLRALRRRPSFAGVAVLTLALSVGSATLVFSLVEGILIRTQPVEDIANLYRLRTTNRDFMQHESEMFRRAWNDLPISFEQADILRSSAGVSALTVYQPDSQPIGLGPQGRQQTTGLRIGQDFFTTLGVDPVLGRWPSPSEIDRFAAVVVIRETLWERAFNRDPAVLGQTMEVRGDPYIVIGVAPAWFAVPNGNAQWWAPFQPRWAEERHATVLEAIARAAPGTPEDQLGVQLQSRLSALGESNADYGDVGVRLIPLREHLTAGVASGLWLLVGAVALLLLVAGVNLVNLVIAHTARRLPELGLRSALGAGRRALLGPVLMEVAVIAVVGGGLGVAIAVGALEPLTGFLVGTVPGFPALADISINAPVLGFSVLSTTALALMAGLLSALWGASRGPADSLRTSSARTGGRGARRIQRVLLVTEAGLAMILLVGAGLLARSTMNILSVDPGFEPSGMAYLWASLPASDFETEEQVQAATAEIKQQIESVPGLRVRAQASTLPSFGGANLSPVRVTGTPPEADAIVLNSYVSPEYFDALAIPVVRGRGFEPGDRAGGDPVAVIGESLAAQLFGDQDPIGRSLTRSTGVRMVDGEILAAGNREVIRVVGVVGDVRQRAIVDPPDPVLYRPIPQVSHRSPFFMVEGVATGAALEQVRQAVGTVPGVVALQSGYHSDALLRVVGHYNAKALLLVVIAVLAGALAMVGVYGVVAYIVSEQKRDIGIRVALGSRSGNEAGRMIREALVPTVAGASLGVAVAMAASGVLASSVFEVSTLDPVSYATTFAVLLTSAVAAAWIPARRAARIDPLEVLKEE